MRQSDTERQGEGTVLEIQCGHDWSEIARARGGTGRIITIAIAVVITEGWSTLVVAGVMRMGREGTAIPRRECADCVASPCL